MSFIFYAIKNEKDEFHLDNGKGWGNIEGEGRPTFWLALHNVKSQLSWLKGLYEQEFLNARIVKIEMKEWVETEVDT